MLLCHQTEIMVQQTDARVQQSSLNYSVAVSGREAAFMSGRISGWSWKWRTKQFNLTSWLRRIEWFSCSHSEGNNSMKYKEFFLRIFKKSVRSMQRKQLHRKVIPQLDLSLSIASGHRSMSQFLYHKIHFINRRFIQSNELNHSSKNTLHAHSTRTWMSAHLSVCMLLLCLSIAKFV